jgi:hypothetical protein
MILLISSLEKAGSLGQSLQEETGEPVQVCATFALAVTQLQGAEFSAVVLDQLLMDAEPDAGETARKHFGRAVPVYINVAVNGTTRVVRELRSALKRRQREVEAAKMDAEQTLRHEFSDSITALLLSCELALQVPDLPPSAQAKMQTVGALAKEMSLKLGAMA